MKSLQADILQVRVWIAVVYKGVLVFVRKRNGLDNSR